jgi:hypothetical protein
LGLALLGGVVQVVLGAVFLSIGHAPRPHAVPVAVVAGTAGAHVLTPLHASSAPRLLSAPNDVAARALMARRGGYGIFVLQQGRPVRVEVASAASPTLAAFLRKTVAGPAGGRVADLHPLPASDTGGGSLLLLIQAVVTGAQLVSLGTFTRRLARRAASPGSACLPERQHRLHNGGEVPRERPQRQWTASTTPLRALR